MTRTCNAIEFYNENLKGKNQAEKLMINNKNNQRIRYSKIYEVPDGSYTLDELSEILQIKKNSIGKRVNDFTANGYVKRLTRGIVTIAIPQGLRQFVQYIRTT